MLSLSKAEALATGKRNKEMSSKTAMVTPMSLPTPKQVLYGATYNQDKIFLVSIDVTTPKGAIQWNHVPELVSLKLMLHLYYVKE